MSILGKDWNLSHERKDDESLWSALMAARGVEDPGSFFSEAQLSDLHDPFLFPDMQKAVERIQSAILERERVLVYGDYDVDGTSGAAILIHTLRFLGAEVSYRIPHRRRDGYGLHSHYVKELAAQDVKILITVDCGISCAAEVEEAESLGMNIIITDHHTIPKKMPPAFATLHPGLAPDYPFKKLSGSGMAFKLACGLLHASGNEEMILSLTDLASLGTVADCVPLKGENRAIVKLGLKQMLQTKWGGLRAILQSSGAWEKGNFTSETIGFQVGPRINACGRIDDPIWALQALLSEGQDAHEKSQKLEELNKQRQALTASMMEEAEKVVNHDEAILIAAGKNWSSGIVGLIAGRLQEKYGKPAFILEDRGESMVGSARSLPGFHAVQALDSVASHLNGYGGHAQAAGFNLDSEHFPEFQSKLQKYAKDLFKGMPPKPALNLDLVLDPSELHMESHEKIQEFAPFGIGNPQPNFLLENVTVLNTRTVGSEGQHLKFTLKHGKTLIDGIAFRFGEHEEQFQGAKRVVVNLDINEWKGERKLQLRLLDFSV
jgi:single-stranded-DNA-specific exonuclease